jgi:hypothetical protein
MRRVLPSARVPSPSPIPTRHQPKLYFAIMACRKLTRPAQVVVEANIKLGDGRRPINELGAGRR